MEMFSNPEILYNGHHERFESFFEALTTQAEFFGIMEEEFPDRGVWGAVWSREDALAFGIAKPYSQAASATLASHIPAEELWDR